LPVEEAMEKEQVEGEAAQKQVEAMEAEKFYVRLMSIGAMAASDSQALRR
jgi:hypothetical protein